MRLSVFAFAVIFAAGCGDKQASPAPPDLQLVFDLTINSNCGHPGDTGNSLGVGRFCEKASDCGTTPHPSFCTKIAVPDEYFCTFACDQKGPAEQCGEKARCACSGGACGCYPTTCDEPQDAASSGG